MNDFIGFALKSRTGLIRFVLMMCGVFGGIFFFYLIMLIALVLDGSIGKVDIPFMGSGGIILSGVCFASSADRLIRMGVNCGVSRKTILKGLAAAVPVYAAVSAAMTALAELIAELVYQLFGLKLLGFGHELAEYFLWEIKDNWRMRVYGCCAVFMLTLFALAAGLMFVGGKMHSRRRGITAAAVTVFGYWVFSVNLDYDGWLYDLLERSAVATNPEYFAWQFDNLPSLFFTQCELLALTLVGVYLLYGIFAVMLRNAPIRGRETG